MPRLLFALAAAAATAPALKPGSAGAGYWSGKVRLPAFPPTYSMNASTIFMVCNETGWHNVSESARFGWAQYDWSNSKRVWVDHHPMDDQAMLDRQAAMVHAAAPHVRIGVYRSAIKALPWFDVVRAKLEDPEYSGWFVHFADYATGTNHSTAGRRYNVNPCDATKCSGLYHEQTQVPAWTDSKKHIVDGDCAHECDCGKLPCGNYIFNHSNTSFAEWFVSDDGPIISNDTVLDHANTGIYGLYLDDAIYGTGFVSEASTYFKVDAGISDDQGKALVVSFNQNMERLYDRIIEKGGFAWQMFWEPNSNGQANGPHCQAVLGNACKSGNPDFEKRPLLYEVGMGKDGTDFDYGAAEQATVNFLLTRGPYAYIGYDWNGCYGDGVNDRKLSNGYHRPPLWDEDFGTPQGSCFQTADGSGVFRRNWTNAVVTWDCNEVVGKRGSIDRSTRSSTKPLTDLLVI